MHRAPTDAPAALRPDSGDGLPAELHFPLFRLISRGNTLAEDQELLAPGAEGPFPLVPGDVADVGVLQPDLHGDPAGSLQGGDGSRRRVRSCRGGRNGRSGRGIRAQFVPDPGTHLADCFRVVVVRGDEQVGDLRWTPELSGFQSPEDRGQPSLGHSPVEILGESLQVHIRTVQEGQSSFRGPG